MIIKVKDGKRYGLIFRAWRLDPVTKERIYPAEGKRCIPIWIRLD